MRVLALVPNLLRTTPGQRGSIEAWEPVLAENDIELTYAVFESASLHEVVYTRGNTATKVLRMGRDYVRRFRDVTASALDGFDAVFVYREAALIGPAVFERLAARRLPVIYQLDDPLHIPYRSPYSGYLSYLKFFGKVRSLCRLATTVIVNSGPLRTFAKEVNDNVWQVPSLVDTDRYVYVPKAIPEGPVCIGWTGSETTAPNLQVVLPALIELRRRAVPHRVHLIGSESFDLPGLEFTSQPWRAETEVEDLRVLDIGLVPLPLNEWNKRKFLMKIAQYMSLGIPPVATPLGSAPEDIQAGVNGYLADSTQEWADALQRLVEDHDLRLRMSAAAAGAAEERYSLRANAPTVVAAFRSTIQ